MEMGIKTHTLCGNKRPTRCNRLVFIAKLIVRSTCFGHHYAHHQELELYRWLPPVVLGAVKMENVIYNLGSINVI
jgi:hypothetical protein